MNDIEKELLRILVKTKKPMSVVHVMSKCEVPNLNMLKIRDLTPFRLSQLGIIILEDSSVRTFYLKNIIQTAELIKPYIKERAAQLKIVSKPLFKPYTKKPKLVK